jgi:hypothetical protein
MSEALILEFDGLDSDQYMTVNGHLGVNPVSGQGDWPEGLISHTGAGKPGGWVVFEVWDSKEAQERFMTERLGPALHEGGVTSPPTRMEWLELKGHVTP